MYKRTNLTYRHQRASCINLYTYLSRVSESDNRPMGINYCFTQGIRLLTTHQGPDLQCYVSRIASHPERLQYIYFNTVLLLRAVARLGPYLSAYDYCASGAHEDDAITYSRLEKILEIAGVAGKFDETALFRGESANVLG